MSKILSGLICLLVITSVILIGCSNDDEGTSGLPGQIGDTVIVQSTAQQSVIVIDKPGHYVEVEYPVKRIVSLNQGMSQLLCAFGEVDRLAGRSVFCTFPSYLKEVKAMGKSSQPNFELIAEASPDLILADPMLYDTTRAKLESMGIPVYIDSSSDPDRLVTLIRNVGLMLGEEEKADEIAAYLSGYIDLVVQRIGQLELDGGDKPTVFYEFKDAYKSASAESAFHKPIVQAGGINIAAGQPVSSPVLSSEWVFAQNPSIMVHRLSGDDSLEKMKGLREEIMNRPGLAKTDAVTSSRVYIIKADAFLTIRYPVGLLYYAKWFHPDLFEDIDPEAVHREIVEKFFGEGEWESLKESFVCTN